MEYYLAIKRNELTTYREQQRWVPKTLFCEQETKHKRVLIVWFYLYESLEKINLIFSDRKQIRGCLWLKVGGRLDKGAGEFGDVRYLLCFNCGQSYISK